MPFETERDIVARLRSALQAHGTRMSDWAQAQRRIGELLASEVQAHPELANDHGLALGRDRLSLQLGLDAHRMELAFRGLQSGNVEVVYRSPYLPLVEGGRPAATQLGVESAALLCEPTVIARYVHAFYKRAALELENERAELKPIEG